MLFRLAVETGLRAGEIRNLTPRSFDLDALPPTVTVQAAFSKHRREDVQPLPPNLAVKLRAFVEDRPVDNPVFSLPSRYNIVRMLRADSTDARSAWIDDAGMDQAERKQRERTSFLAYRDESGRVIDFHAFRHTFITNLARGGVHPKQAQDLARHSDINLTMSRYSHTVMADRAAALEALPDLSPRPVEERQRATGTHGKDSGMCTSMWKQGSSEGRLVSSDGTETEHERHDETRVSTDEKEPYDASRHSMSPPDNTEGAGSRTQDLRLKRPLLYH